MINVSLRLVLVSISTVALACIILTIFIGAGLPPYVTPEKAAKTDGVFVYRNIADLDAIIAYAEKEHVKRAVIVGGGLLGLEAAKAAYDLET